MASLIPTIVERLEKSRDFAGERYEKVYQIVRQAKKLTRGIAASEDLVSRAKTDKQNKVASDAERDAEPISLEVLELEAKVSSGEGELRLAVDPLAFLQDAKFVESPPTPFGTARGLREQRELDQRAALDNVQTAAAIATELSRTPIGQLRARATTAAEVAQWALYSAIHREAKFRSEAGDPEARRLSVELESFVRKNPPAPVVAGQSLISEITLFANATRQSMFALRSHRPDGSRMMIDAWNEERREGRSGGHWFMTQNALGEATLRTASGRRLGQNPPSENPVPVPPPPKPPPPPPSE